MIRCECSCEFDFKSMRLKRKSNTVVNLLGSQPAPTATAAAVVHTFKIDCTQEFNGKTVQTKCVTYKMS